jgi:hypothetical protein
LAPGDFTVYFGDYYQGGEVDVPIPQGSTYLMLYGGPGGDWTWEFHENVLHYEFYPVYYWHYESQPITPSSVGWIEAAMFMGTPQWGFSEIWTDTSTLNTLYWLWEDSVAFPRRPALGRIANDVPVPAQNFDDPAARDGLKLLGRLHCLPKLGSVTFEPA